MCVTTHWKGDCPSSRNKPNQVHFGNHRGVFEAARDHHPEPLARFKALTNSEGDSQLVLSIVPTGTSPLRDLLRRDGLEDVARSIAHDATPKTLWGRPVDSSSLEKLMQALQRCDLQRYCKRRCADYGYLPAPAPSGR